MSPAETFEIKAEIDWHSAGVGCFDPFQVICRMRVAFPDVVIEDRDPVWETYEGIRQMPDSEGKTGALRIALKDVHERGPKFLFRIPVGDGRVVRGTAERYWVLVHSPEEFPPDFRRRFTTFLQGLTLQPITIT